MSMKWEKSRFVGSVRLKNKTEQRKLFESSREEKKITTTNENYNTGTFYYTWFIHFYKCMCCSLVPIVPNVHRRPTNDQINGQIRPKKRRQKVAKYAPNTSSMNEQFRLWYERVSLMNAFVELLVIFSDHSFSFVFQKTILSVTVVNVVHMVHSLVHVCFN